jgi:hypothetical protein
MNLQALSTLGRSARDARAGLAIGVSETELVAAASGWQAGCVKTYGQYCPIARASELLGERWSIIGPPALARALPTWNRRAWAADDPRARYDGSTQRQPAPPPVATSA